MYHQFYFYKNHKIIHNVVYDQKNVHTKIYYINTGTKQRDILLYNVIIPFGSSNTDSITTL